MRSKVCPRCNKEFPATLEFFYKDGSKKGGSTCWCIKCSKKYQREYSQTEHGKKVIKRARLRLYDITVKDYNKIFQQQKGRCAICGKHQSKIRRRLDIDHDHKTEKIRGLLCSTCNTQLAPLENKEFRTKAEEYLKSNR